MSGKPELGRILNDNKSKAKRPAENNKWAFVKD